MTPPAKIAASSRRSTLTRDRPGRCGGARAAPARRPALRRRQADDGRPAARRPREQDEGSRGERHAGQRAEAGEPADQRVGLDLAVAGHGERPLGQRAGDQQPDAPQRRGGGRGALVERDRGGDAQRGERDGQRGRVAHGQQPEPYRAEHGAGPRGPGEQRADGDRRRDG
jgi:hypothetical protein